MSISKILSTDQPSTRRYWLISLPIRRHSLLTPLFEEPEWIVHYDGAWDTASAGVSAILTQPSGSRLWYAARLEFLSMNNNTEYEAMILGLQKLRALGIRRCIIKLDSQVIVGHIKKNFAAKEPKLVR